jgi:hypothetical protein
MWADLATLDTNGRVARPRSAQFATLPRENDLILRGRDLLKVVVVVHGVDGRTPIVVARRADQSLDHIFEDLARGEGA